MATSSMPISKSTTISISLVITFITVAFFVGSLNTKANRTAEDVDKILSVIETDQIARNDISKEMGQLSVRLESFNERLDSFDGRLDDLSQSQASVTVETLPPAQTVTVQPSNPGVEIQLPGSKSDAKPSTEPTPTQERPSFGDQLVSLPCSILSILCRSN